MSFYGIVLVFVILIAVLYLNAFQSEVAYVNGMSLAFARSGSALEKAAPLVSANP